MATAARVLAVGLTLVAAACGSRTDDEPATTAAPPDQPPSDAVAAALPDAAEPPRYVLGIGDAIDLSCGAAHCCAVRASGRVACWGNNDKGQVAPIEDDVVPTPVDVSGIEGATRVSAGNYHTCAIVGEGAVYCWGANTGFQLGVARDDLERAPPQRIPNIDDAITIDSWHHTSCAVTATARIKCWGRIYRGLGAERSSFPTTSLAGTGYVDVAVGAAFICGATRAGAVWCIGSYWPRRTKLSGMGKVVQLDGTELHACAVNERGRAYCWGTAFHGALGNAVANPMVTEVDPVTVQGLQDVTQISVGATTSCAHTTDGPTFCWGSASLLTSKKEPVLEPAPAFEVSSEVATLAVGSNVACRRHLAGRIACAGFNLFGQRGIGVVTRGY